MQKRHQDRHLYFQELASTSRKYYIDYLKPYVEVTAGTRVLEIGCGEGGNLLPFAEAGCYVKGVDLSATRIEQAQQFFEEAGQHGTFSSENFITAEKPATDDERFDLVLIHDVVEHIEEPYKADFFTHIKPFVKRQGIVFFGFPAWQMPFGGHQQIRRGLVSKLPFIHLLPDALYTRLLKVLGATPEGIAELMSIKRSRMSIEHFEELARQTGYTVVKRTLWLVNPHYEQKFGLRPRRLWRWVGRLPYVRNFFSTSAFYLLRTES